MADVILGALERPGGVQELTERLQKWFDGCARGGGQLVNGFKAFQLSLDLAGDPFDVGLEGSGDRFALFTRTIPSSPQPPTQRPWQRQAGEVLWSANDAC